MLGPNDVSRAKSESPIRKFSLQQLAERFPLSWTHYVRLMRRTRSPEERSFYEGEALRGGWSVGYEDAGFFSRLFTRKVGLTPAQYHRRFGAITYVKEN